MKASEWVAKQDAGLTTRDQSEFLDWLSEDSIHSEYFAEQLEAWEDFDLLEQWRPRHSEEPNPDLLALPRQHHPVRRFIAWGAIAATVVILASSTLLETPTEPEVQQVQYLSLENVAKGFERHVLEDGSEIQMNRGSQVSVHFSPNRRVAKLYSGEAYFSVAKDPERPFLWRLMVLKFERLALRSVLKRGITGSRFSSLKGMFNFKRIPPSIVLRSNRMLRLTNTIFCRRTKCDRSFES